MSTIRQVERTHQAQLVSAIKEAERAGIFDKDNNKIKSTSTQRKYRYSIAADRVERITQDMQSQIENLSIEGKRSLMVDKKNPTFFTMEVRRLETKKEHLLAHLAVLRSPDSLFCIPPLHPVRVKLDSIIHDASFGVFINACIAFSSFTLALERPGIGVAERTFLDAMNSILNAIFLLECLMKIVALSFFSYWADKWNRLDLAIVGIAYLDEVVTRVGANVGTGALKVSELLVCFDLYDPYVLFAIFEPLPC